MKAVRFVVAIAGLAALVALATGGFLLHGVRNARERRWTAALERTLDDFSRAYEGRRARQQESMRELIHYLRRDNPELLRQLIDRAELESASLGLIVRAHGFDRLDMLDPSHRVIASTEKSRLGLLEPLTSNADSVRLEADRDSLPQWITRSELVLGSSRFLLLARTAWNNERLAELLPAATGARITLAGSSWVWESPVVAADARGRPGDAPRRLRRSRGFDAASVGDERLQVELSLDRARSNEDLAGWVWLLAAAVLASAGGGALVGLYLAGSARQPVLRLTRAVDAIAAGQADYTFSNSAGDAFDELAASFSRLQRRLDAQRERSLAAERVAAWRDVAQRVAHEVKNPLAPIRLTVQNLLRVRSRAPERFEELFEEGMHTILEEVEQLARMVSEFSEFARMPLPDPQPAALPELIDAVLELYAAEPNLVLTRHYSEEIPPLTLDAGQMTRALKNICGNAVEAMRGRHESGQAPHLTVSLSLDDSRVVVAIDDNGPGLGEEARRRLFEPYFTTKEGGTGLGMAMTYRIIVEHGGSIDASNRPEGGARIKLTLPLQTRIS